MNCRSRSPVPAVVFDHVRQLDDKLALFVFLTGFKCVLLNRSIFVLSTIISNQYNFFIRLLKYAAITYASCLVLRCPSVNMSKGSICRITYFRSYAKVFVLLFHVILIKNVKITYIFPAECRLAAFAIYVGHRVQPCEQHSFLRRTTADIDPGIAVSLSVCFIVLRVERYFKSTPLA